MYKGVNVQFWTFWQAVRQASRGVNLIHAPKIPQYVKKNLELIFPKKQSPLYKKKIFYNGQWYATEHLNWGTLYKEFKSPKINSSRRYFSKLRNISLRLRFERFLFKKTQRRIYVWFKNVLQISLYKFRFWRAIEKLIIAKFTWRRGNKLRVKPDLAIMAARSIGLMFTAVGGMFFFTQIFKTLVQKFRRHWALLKKVSEYMEIVRNSFWYRFWIQYRMVLSGKFSGTMRAGKRIISKGGDLRLYEWEGMLDFSKTAIPTRWGTFGFCIWVQIRPVKNILLGRHFAKIQNQNEMNIVGLESVGNRIITPHKNIVGAANKNRQQWWARKAQMNRFTVRHINPNHYKDKTNLV